MGERRTGVWLEPRRTGARRRRDVPRRGRSPAARVPASHGEAAAWTRSGPDPGSHRPRTADRPAADGQAAALPAGRFTAGHLAAGHLAAGRLAAGRLAAG